MEHFLRSGNIMKTSPVDTRLDLRQLAPERIGRRTRSLATGPERVRYQTVVSDLRRSLQW
jgi:hypothetical protein